jgi:predicted HAD superfamily phosphohydrolase YqeG
MLFGKHIIAGFHHGFRHRYELAHILRKTPRDFSLLTIDPALLKADGIAALALDFDGVLSPHGCAAPVPEAVDWLTRSGAVFGENKVFILSNKPTEVRRRWFAEHFPEMRFISGVRKKPFPDGLTIIAELSGVPPSAVVMVDDRLLTGCLGAILAGARPCYISNPSVSFRYRPFAEMFFMVIRKMERAVVRMMV